MALSESGYYIVETPVSNFDTTGRLWFGPADKAVRLSESGRFGFGFPEPPPGGVEPPPPPQPGVPTLAQLGAGSMMLFGRNPAGMALRRRIPCEDRNTQANGLITGNNTGPLSDRVIETSDVPGWKVLTVLYYNGVVSSISIGYGVNFGQAYNVRVIPIKSLTGNASRKFWFVRGFSPTGTFIWTLNISQTGSCYLRRSEE